MAVEGVMVSYDYSEDKEHSNIITVSASGVKFSNRWVLTHGSILSPLKQARVIKNARGKPLLSEDFYNNLPEIYVTCERDRNTKNLYEEIEECSRQRDEEFTHPSYLIKVVTGRICHVWQCPVLERCVGDILYSWTVGHRDADVEQQTQLGKALLSVFVLVDLEPDQRGPKILRPLSELFDLVKPPPDRGASLEVHSTPFGCEVFLNAVTRGAVCGVVGKRPSLLLTDASTALGSEGGPVYLQADSSLIGLVVCSVSWWRGEWVGLTLVAPLTAVLAAKLRVDVPRTIDNSFSKHMQILDQIDRGTVLVRCGGAWGAGVARGGGAVLAGAARGGGAVLTAAHVVARFMTSTVSLYCKGVKETAIVRYKTPDNKAYDLALLYSNPENWTHLKPPLFATDPPEKGEPVLAAGYPYFNENNIDDLKTTVTSGYVTNVSPSMLQTSCCVQSGFSGGPIFRINQGRLEVVGIIVSNAKTQAGACYPYVNMAVPVSAIEDTVAKFLEDKDVTKLSSIENNSQMIQAQWRLLPFRSKI